MEAVKRAPAAEETVFERYRDGVLMERREECGPVARAIGSCEHHAARGSDVVLYRKDDRKILWSNRFQSLIGEVMPE